MSNDETRVIKLTLPGIPGGVDVSVRRGKKPGTAVLGITAMIGRREMIVDRAQALFFAEGLLKAVKL